MFKVITIRCKGGSSEYEEAQMAALRRQEELDRQLEAIDLEFYEMRQANKQLYDEQFRPLEESLLRRAAGPARESTSAAARATEYAAAEAASTEALERRQARMGVRNLATEARPEDEYIRAIALTAVGNAGKASALETQSALRSASIGAGVGVNQDILRTYGRAMTGMQRGLGHADAAFTNYAQAQSHTNQAYASRQAGNTALMQAGVGVAGMGISNYQQAQYAQALSGSPTTEVTWQSAFSGAPTPTPLAGIAPPPTGESWYNRSLGGDWQV
ncbi:MAG: hypothetical protein ACYSWO_27265 [Planctomycetota bacterium]|jgi:hypothetical protein